MHTWHPFCYCAASSTHVDDCIILCCHAQLESEGHKCTSIQGDMEKEARDRVVEEFRSGTTKILIATDVLARGFDVTQVAACCDSCWACRQCNVLSTMLNGTR